MDDVGAGSRVLLVEDEILISDIVSEILAEHGFEVYVAATAQDALRHLRCGAPCDILFTDINLPGGIDGTVLAKLARELRPGLPVVYASGGISHLNAAVAVPGSAFVPKPYDPFKVCSLLGQFAPAHHVAGA